MILALDLGAKTGWAYVCEDGSALSGTLKFKAGKFVSYGKRFAEFRDWLERLHDLEGVDEVVFEAVRRHIGTDAAHVYGGFLATLTSWCDSQVPPVPYSGVGVGTIKKHATGNGNAKKPEMIAAAVKRGYRPVDDNEADALALLDYRLSTEKGIMG